MGVVDSRLVCRYGGGYYISKEEIYIRHMATQKIKKGIKFVTYALGAITVVFLGSSLLPSFKKSPPPIEEVYADFPSVCCEGDSGDM